jgi:hypothetical protein
MRALLLALAAILVPSFAFAWDNHDQLSAVSLAGEEWAKSEVTVEGLDTFLAEVKTDLAPALAKIEKQARADYPRYMPLPASLEFDPASTGEALRASFIGAIRINPTVPLALFLQVPAGGSRAGRPDLEISAADPYGGDIPNPPFVSLKEGERVTALEVVETASDEPDFGLDIGLFTDNGTEWGARYGFGIQPFGNPKLSYGSQAPFHMNFANESGVIHALAGFTAESFVGYRYDLYSALARLAFSRGHPYWGWRFAGWALHYVQDTTQPYHSSLLPAKTTFGILALNAFGSKQDKDAALTLLSNRHLLLETYQYSVMAAWKGDYTASPLYAALRGLPGSRILAADLSGKGWLLGKVAKRARSRGRELDRAIGEDFPAKYVSDPGFDYGAWQADNPGVYDPRADLLARAPDKAPAFDAVVAKSLEETGAVAREFLASFLPGR